MKRTRQQLWERFQKFNFQFDQAGLAIDLSRVDWPDDFLDGFAGRMKLAFDAMAKLEAGAIANPDEKRMVGHYWLRAPELAPTKEIREEIENTLASIKEFTAKVHAGSVKGSAGPFEQVLVVGIGGSALGPQFVAHALGHAKKDKMRPYFFDNTDPDGMAKVLAALDGKLGSTLTLVISKSGGTKETRNGMLEAKAAYEAAGLSFAAHAAAVTGVGSELDQYASKNGWIARFPMWDWVGGRTSELSAVGLLPAALQGLDIDGMLLGARTIDALTRNGDLKANPSGLLAAAWFFIGNGKGEKDMVILPYKDRLELFSKYLQQLIMESLGKEMDLSGAVVNQGIAVYGNKGSTDQHAYVQQLRDGVKNFFVTFVEVLKDQEAKSIEVEPGVTSGDYLSGFLQGTREALYESGRQSITITVPEVSGFYVGLLIGLYERAVGLYATLINVNAYHQPGVEAGKKAATVVIAIQHEVVAYLAKNKEGTVEAIASGIGKADYAETVYKVLEHLAANGNAGVGVKGGPKVNKKIYFKK